MALIFGALIMHGIQPGPTVMTRNPELFWGVVASMFVGNVMLVALNLPLVGVWMRLLAVPYRWLFPCIIMFCAFGNYTVNSNVMDVYVCAAIGVLGYVLAKLDCPPAPMVLGYVLGPMMEEYMRRALLLSGGDAMVFFRSPLSLFFIASAVLLLISMAMPAVRRKKSIAYEEDSDGNAQAKA